MDGRPQAHQVCRSAGVAVRQRGARLSSQSATGSRDRQETSRRSPIRVARPATQAKASVLCARVVLSKQALTCASPVGASRDEAVCIGLTKASRLRSVSLSSSAVSELGVRIHERKIRSMFEGMRVLLKIGVASNNRMNLTRSARQTDRRGPCRLSACSTGLCGKTKTADAD
jgi:hypothetical protein